MDKVIIKRWWADQQFRYDLGLKQFNNIRTVMMIVIMINSFLLLLKPSKIVIYIIYGLAIFLGTFGIWLIGYIFDKMRMQFYFDQAYFDRGKANKKFEELQNTNNKI